MGWLEKWAKFLDNSRVEWTMFALGVILLIISPLVGAIPPGPGIAPTSGEMMRRMTPSANIVHSTRELSRNFAHFSSQPMRVNLVIHRCGFKALAGQVRSGLASLRRARGKSAQR